VPPAAGPLPEPVPVSPREFALREGADPAAFEASFVGESAPNPVNAAASVTGSKTGATGKTARKTAQRATAAANPGAFQAGSPDALRVAAMRGEQQAGVTPAPRVVPPPSGPTTVEPSAPRVPAPDTSTLQKEASALRAQILDEERAVRARLAEQPAQPKSRGLRADFKDIEDYLTPAQLREVGLRGGKAAKKPTKKLRKKE
jgi:hypothetical protein